VAQFYHDVLAFKARKVGGSLSDIAKSAIEIASEYLGLYSSMEHKLGTLVALTAEDLSSIERRFDEEEPSPNMFDTILGKVEKVVRDQFRLWQGAQSAHKRAKSSARGTVDDGLENESAEESFAASEKFEQQPANVTNQRLLKKFGAVPVSSEFAAKKK